MADDGLGQRHVTFSTRDDPKKRASLYRQISSSNEGTFQDAKRVLILADRMRSGLRSKTFDRRWRNLKVYKKCFLHSDAIAWLIEDALSECAKSQSTDDQEDVSTSKREHHHHGGPIVSTVTAPFQPTHMKSGNDFTISEEVDAVNRANEMIAKGYVSHVANDHTFKVGETKVLFFRFHDETIDLDLQAMMNRETRSVPQQKTSDEENGDKKSMTVITEKSKLQEDISELNAKVVRLNEEMAKYTAVLDDAHGKILVLETTVVSLTCVISVMILVTVALFLFEMLGKGRHLVASAVFPAGVVTLSLLWGRQKSATSPLLSEHATILARVATTGDMEGALLQDLSDDDDISVASTVSTEKENALVRIGRSVSQRLYVGSSLSISHHEDKLKREQHLKIKMREASDIPPPSNWAHRPVFLCVNTGACPELTVPKYGAGSCPLGVPFHFSSDLFEGICLVRLRDVPSDDPDGDSAYFDGRRRKFQGIVQGRFKEELKVSDVLTGHEFVRPLKRLPPAWILRTSTSLIRKLAPGAEIDLDVRQPKAMSLLAATSQEVSADMPGTEPKITSNNIKEDMAVFGGIFSQGDVPTSRRKKYLADPQHAAEYKFDTESVYTFDFYQNMLDVATYSLDLGFTKIGLAKNLDGQPIQIMSKTTDGRYLWSFQVWHEKLLKRKQGCLHHKRA